MLLSDKEIRGLCQKKRWVYAEPAYRIGEVGVVMDGKIGHWEDITPMIEPFSEAVSGDGTISYGLTSSGYDLRMDEEVLIFKNSSGLSIDPKRFKEEGYKELMFDYIKTNQPVTIPAHGYILAKSLEYVRIPRNIKGRVEGKSTYARCGIICNLTAIEPGWEGHITIEISNSSPCPAVVYPLEGIAQLEFETILGEVEQDYSQKHGGKPGKYQGQTGVTAAIVR